ncbi:MAG: caspase family protein [Paludibacteraceae bacterium]|nr:caspase family protein [Paludibacteraceae bacterium]
MKWIFSILLVFLSVTSSMAQNRAYKDSQTGKWGFRNDAGNVAVKPIYDEYDQGNTFTNSKHFAVVRLGDLWGCIGKDGEYVTKLIFKSKLLAIKAGQEWNKKAKLGESLYEGFDVKTHKYGFADYQGNWVISPILDDVDSEYSFVKGKKYAVVKCDGCWGSIDRNGVFSTKPVLVSNDDARSANSEVSVSALLGESIYDAYDASLKKWGFANSLGNWAIRPIFDNIDRQYSFSSGRAFAVVKYKGKWGCVSRLGSFIVKPTYANAAAAKGAGFAWQGKNPGSISASDVANIDDGKYKNSYLATNSGVKQESAPANNSNANKSNNNQGSNGNVVYTTPPTIKILTPKNGSDYTTSELTFTYEAKTADGKAPEILVYINGELQPRTKGVKRVGSQMTIAMPRIEDCRVQLIAKDANGQNSDPAVVLLHYRGDRPKPNLHIFAVGVSDYDQEDLKLQHAAKDASDFSKTISNMPTNMYVKKAPVLITDKSATDKNIKKGLSNLVNKVEQGDVIMLFFSGHGSKEGSETYFLSCNAESNDLFSSSVNFDAIRTAIKRLKDRKCRVLVFMDACHSGALYGQKSVTESFALSDPGVIGFYSSTESQKSNESEQWNNGIFTKALLEGFNGKAVDQDGNITIDELERYVRESVRKATNGKQMPIFENKQGNFVLFEANK